MEQNIQAILSNIRNIWDILIRVKKSSTTNTSDITDIQTTINSYGDVVSHDASDFATSSQGTKADTALQSGDNVSELVNDAGYINSLSGYATENWVNSQGFLTSHQSLSGYATEAWVGQQGFLTSHQDISGKADISSLASVAFSGDYNDLINVPSGGGITVDQIFDSSSTNPQSGVAIAGELSNYALASSIPSLTGYATESWVNSQGFLTSHQSLSGYATESWVNNQGFLTAHQDISGKANTVDLATVAFSGDYDDLINQPTIPTVPTTLSSFTDNLGSNPVHTHSQYLTGISSSDIISALGYTPYSDGNPNGYTSNIGTVTSVNNTTPINGDVSLTIPSDTGDLTNGAGYITGITNTDVINALTYTPANNSDLANYVTKTGDTMSGNLTIMTSNAASRIILKSSDYTVGDTLTEDNNLAFTFHDNQGTTLGFIQRQSRPDGTTRLMMNCRNKDTTSNSNIIIGYDANGNVYTQAPTPSNSSNDTNIATTAYVRNTSHGEWVASNYTIMENVSLNGSTNLTYNLSSYLPHDNDTYEVLIACRTTATSTGFTDLQISALNSYMYGGYSSKGVLASSSSTLLAKYNTTITVRRTANWNGTASIYCRAYRRVSY